MLTMGYSVFSPLSHTVPMSKFIPRSLRYKLNFWLSVDLPMLSACSTLNVLMLRGWRDSVGVKCEIKIAERQGIAVVYVNPQKIKEQYIDFTNTND